MTDEQKTNDEYWPWRVMFDPWEEIVNPVGKKIRRIHNIAHRIDFDADAESGLMRYWRNKGTA